MSYTLEHLRLFKIVHAVQLRAIVEHKSTPDCVTTAACLRESYRVSKPAMPIVHGTVEQQTNEAA
eukprot:1151932-Pelagomonas_calceolata.AAC.2